MAKFSKCIKDVDSWMSKNMLKLNPLKTEFMVMGSSHSLSKLSIPDLHIYDSNIHHSSIVRNLGVMFDPTLSLKDHISHMCKSINYHLRNIGKIRKLLTTEATHKAVHALISSRLDYANSILYGLPSKQLARLQHLQNNAARIISLKKKYDHITPILQSLHWLPVPFRVMYKILLLTFKALNNLAPDYLSEMVCIQQHQRKLRSNNERLLQIPRTRTVTYGDRAFSFAAPKLWNDLPTHLRSIDSIDVFKSNLKTYLFQQAYCK
jgi:hypothetical protein